MLENQGSFDPETLAILKAAFDDACAHLAADQRTAGMRSTVAERILKLAARGERDPIRLRTYALLEVTPLAQQQAG
jgi:hypothetical protein